MERRNVLKSMAVSLPLLSGCAAVKNNVYGGQPHESIKPRGLSPGDTIGLVSPGSSLSEEALIKAVNNIESLGYQVKTGRYWDGRYGYLAGRDVDRLRDLHDMFLDSEVSAIWCARGGYGCTRLLPMIDYDVIGKNPKPLIGYSDVTALINAIYLKTGLIGFHGPVASSDFNDFSIAGINGVLDNGITTYELRNAEQTDIDVINSGKASGILIGGNLSIIAALAGTPYQLESKDKLVFIEDVGEKPYRIDRMLTQLLQTGLSQAKGIILGIFNDCEADEGDRSLSLRECLIDRLGNLDIPVALGYSFGHISEQCTIPIGVKASFDTERSTIQLLESAVV